MKWFKVTRFHWYEAKTPMGDLCISRQPGMAGKAEPWLCDWYPMNQGSGQRLCQGATPAQTKLRAVERLVAFAEATVRELKKPTTANHRRQP